MNQDLLRVHSRTL